MSKDNITLASLKEAVLATLKEDVQVDAFNDLEAFVEANYTPNTELDSLEELHEKVQNLEEELSQELLKKANPHEARLQTINGGKTLETIVITEQEEDGTVVAAEKIKARFQFAMLSVPKLGSFKASDLMQDPEKHAHVIQRLVAMQSSALVIESRKALTQAQIKKELKS